jgi:uncharacterized protein YdeI (YjbR/CyaY-like superfamily)
MAPDSGNEQIHPETVGEWRRWLERHHEERSGIWLVSWKSHTGKPRLTYDEAVEEALAFGWVDSTARTIDDERSMLWFARRKPTSGWSRPNKQRVERLEAAGRMAPAGRKAVETAKANGAWTLLDEVENLTVPDDLVAAFAEQPGASDHWDAFPRSARRGILEWIVQAKRPETRQRRIEETARMAARGERANQWRAKRG